MFLLGQKAGLRVSEAINFNLSKKTREGLYFIKSKGKKERLAYIPPQVASELKANNWQPKQTNRWNFYQFLKKIKRKAHLPANTELTPHTLRRAFATYRAEDGLPLPLLSKLLGHKSVRTTALYWMNIYNDDNEDDTADIITAKNWLEKPKKPQPEPDNPVKAKLDKLPEPLTINPQPNYLSIINQLEEKLSQIQSENNNLKSENADLQDDLAELSEQNALLNQQKSQVITEKEQIQQELTTAKETISQLNQYLVNEREKRTTAENNLLTEKQSNHNLHQQLQAKQENNANLTQKLSHSEQTITNLQNACQQALKDKEITQKQLNHLLSEIKKATQQFQQWQKFNYYQQHKKPNELKAQILQPNPPPWKPR